MSDLAITGGARTRNTPFPSVSSSNGRTLGAEELRALEDVLLSGKLNRTIVEDGYCSRLERGFAEWLGVTEAVASSSGTSALHLAVAAIDPNPGDEIITTPITDFGTVIPILAQNAVPVFADVDPQTWCIDPASVASLVTPRTRAIIVVHLFGQSADLDALIAIADEHNIPLIEDCSQAYGATWNGRKVGTFGQLATFSLQQSKHITAGDGGLTVTNDPALARRMRLFSDKGWPRDGEVRTHLFYGVNYRMTELQAAVAWAQLAKLDGVIASRRAVGRQLGDGLADLPGVSLPTQSKTSDSVYWLFPVGIDPTQLGTTVSKLATAISAEGIPASAGYVTPLYLTPVLAEGKTYGDSHFPFDSDYTTRSYRDYGTGLCPNAEAMAESMLLIPINERYTREDVDDIANGVRKVILAMAAEHDASERRR